MNVMSFIVRCKTVAVKWSLAMHLLILGLTPTMLNTFYKESKKASTQIENDVYENIIQ